MYTLFYIMYDIIYNVGHRYTLHRLVAFKTRIGLFQRAEECSWNILRWIPTEYRSEHTESRSMSPISAFGRNPKTF